ncbi:MAG: acetamidase/formamidase family protein, partial [Tetragenococcus koreensis]|nr:acetamidase/formamidase family protein [Tetragenococcus koreensis]
MAKTHKCPTDTVHYTWHKEHEPILTIDSGDTAVFETREVSDNQFNFHSTTEAISELDWDYVYPLSGPVYVNGAEPGDTLAVEILDLKT